MRVRTCNRADNARPVAVVPWRGRRHRYHPVHRSVWAKQTSRSMPPARIRLDDRVGPLGNGDRSRPFEHRCAHDATPPAPQVPIPLQRTRAGPGEGDRVDGGYCQGLPPRETAPTVEGVDSSTDIRDFLTSRRARITPDQAGLPAYGAKRRVAGLRREEAAMLAGISVEYYTRLERGNASGVSDDVLERIARALQLDEAERAHLFDLARAASRARPARHRPSQERVRPAVRRILDVMTEVPAYLRNDRLDILAANPLGRALYSPVFADPAGTTSMARFIFLSPRPPTSSATGSTSPTTPSPSSAPPPRGTPTTGGCPISSASCPPAATSSASGGRLTTSSSTAPEPRPCTTPPSATSPWPTKRSTCPATTASASSCTPPNQDHHHSKHSTCWPSGPRRPPNSMALKTSRRGRQSPDSR